MDAMVNVMLLQAVVRQHLNVLSYLIISLACVSVPSCLLCSYGISQVYVVMVEPFPMLLYQDALFQQLL